MTIPIFTREEHDKACHDTQDAVKEIQLGIHHRLDGVERRLAEHKTRFDSLESTLQDNTTALKAQSESTYELIDVMQSAKGFFRVAGWVGSGLKWALGIATALSAFWITLKAGGK